MFKDSCTGMMCKVRYLTLEVEQLRLTKSPGEKLVRAPDIAGAVDGGTEQQNCH